MKKQTLRAMPAALSIRAAMTTASALATAVIPAALWAADVLLWPSSVAELRAQPDSVLAMSADGAAEGYFSWLPPKDDPDFGAFWSVQDRPAAHGFYKEAAQVPFDRFDFAKANARRAAGQDRRHRTAQGEIRRHRGARRRLGNGLRLVGRLPRRDQDERADAYRAYVGACLDHPRYVGTHWFQWMDQPLTGRPDGENYQIGFVTVADAPYPELVQAARDVAATMYRRRYGQ